MTWISRACASPAASGPASSSTSSSSTASAPASGSAPAFQMQQECQWLQQHHQRFALSQPLTSPQHSQHRLSQHSKCSSSCPRIPASANAIASSVASATSLSWQTQHLQQPVPLEHIAISLADPALEREEPAESSSLVDEVAQGMTPAQSAENVRQRTRYQSEGEEETLGNGPACMESSSAA